MPSKGKRTASRQAKIRQQRRRGRGAAQEFDAGPSEAELAARETTTESGSPPAVATAAPVRSARRSSRSSETTPLSYPYLGAELKRIGVIALLMFIVLAAASFVLG